MKPIRIQRKRTRGWRLPENTVCVNRPTKWGNPLKLVGDMIYIYAGYRINKLDKWVFLKKGDINDVLGLYRRILNGVLLLSETFNKDLTYWEDKLSKLDMNELTGKNVACFCSVGKQCHGDVLLRYANHHHSPLIIKQTKHKK